MQLSDATIRRMRSMGMITLRCSLDSKELKQALGAVSMDDIPETGKFCTEGNTLAAWMSPDELLLMVPDEAVEHMVETIDASLNPMPRLVADVSDARVMFEVQSAGIRDILAKETPADMSESAIGPQDFRRTRLGQVAVAIWFPAPDAARLVCRTSEAEYVRELLAASCASESPGFHDTRSEQGR